jgi:uncharacterized protein with GYD domain
VSGCATNWPSEESVTFFIVPNTTDAKAKSVKQPDRLRIFWKEVKAKANKKIIAVIQQVV